MKNLESTQTQEVKDNATRELNVKAKNVAKEDIKKDAEVKEFDVDKNAIGVKQHNKPNKSAEPSKPTTVPTTSKKGESNEAIGERLLKEKANEATILATFLKVYKTKSNITDKAFVQARANIYMKIAKKRAEAKTKEAKAS